MSRQFVEMTRSRADALLQGFPKLLESNRDQQHTYFETEAVRYLYQPLQSLYLLLLTNLGSNIVEDLQTLYKLSQVIPQVVQPAMDEFYVRDCTFDIIFAFDEVCCLGNTEDITPDQVMTQLIMESNGEKLHQMIQQSKMLEAKDIAKKKAQQLKEEKNRKRQQQKLLASQQGSRGGAFGGPQQIYAPSGSGQFNANQARVTMGSGNGSMDLGGGGMGGSSTMQPQQQVAGSSGYGGGMTLGGGIGGSHRGGGQMMMGAASGGGSTNNSYMANIANEEGLSSENVPSFMQYAAKNVPSMGNDNSGNPNNGNADHQQSGGSSSPGSRSGGPTGGALVGVLAKYAPIPIQASVPESGIVIQLNEDLKISMTGDGDFVTSANSSNSLSGIIRLLCVDERASTVKLKMKMEKGSPVSAAVNWKKLLKTHPYVDKKLFQSKGVVQPKAKKKYPTNKPVDIIRWGLSLNEENKETVVPIEFTAWVDSDDGRCKVFLEYEVIESWNREIRHFLVTIPTGNGDVEFDEGNEAGQFNWNSREGTVSWEIDVIDCASAESDSRHGTLEFHVASNTMTEDSLYPIDVRYLSESSIICPVKIAGCKGMDGKGMPMQGKSRLVAHYRVGR